MNWRQRLGAIAALCCTVLPVVVGAQTPLEQQVLAALNAARTNPSTYAGSLKTYRGFFHANMVTLPGSSEDIETSEGVAVVDETVAFLARQAPLAPLTTADLLIASATDLATDQGATGATGHEGGDGSTPGERVRRHGGGDYVAEVIAYGPVDAIDAIRQLIVDDGVFDRGHRSVIFSPELRYAGVACGVHKEFRTMCVIDLAVTADGRFSHPMRMASVGPGAIASGK